MAWRRRRGGGGGGGGAWGARHVLAWVAVVAATALAAPRGADKLKRGGDGGGGGKDACGFPGTPPCRFRSRGRSALADEFDEISAEDGELDVFVPIIAPVTLQDLQVQPHLSLLATPPAPLLWLVEADMMPTETLGKKAKVEHNMAIKAPARRRFFRRYFRRWMD